MKAKNIIIHIDDNNLESIKKAEKQKTSLENNGYKVINTVCGLTHSIIEMAQIRE